jgi:hypothetical protein
VGASQSSIATPSASATPAHAAGGPRTLWIVLGTAAGAMLLALAALTCAAWWFRAPRLPWRAVPEAPVDGVFALLARGEAPVDAVFAVRGAGV